MEFDSVRSGDGRKGEVRSDTNQLSWLRLWEARDSSRPSCQSERSMEHLHLTQTRSAARYGRYKVIRVAAGLTAIGRSGQPLCLWLQHRRQAGASETAQEERAFGGETSQEILAPLKSERWESALRLGDRLHQKPPDTELHLKQASDKQTEGRT
ncbi:hypothetical protein AAFF_G00136800 [Aldrovandia affinis]|uniref:Uncharacterized protein n=1 Tax=Aldrovandia affinis TaxID=143900 RepID=A0AAD7X1S3_9TELE|nr:hypothetical protein AAFF_G00136800 [Aldrovandia affinis]